MSAHQRIGSALQAALTLARTDKSIMSKNMKKTEAILREMVMITLRGELTKIQRTNLETCITIHMHQKESTGMHCLGHCLEGLVP
jgi:dynein heavy chain